MVLTVIVPDKSEMLVALILFHVLAGVQFLNAVQSADSRERFYSLTHGYRLQHHVIATVITASELSCAHKCSIQDGCMSFNFRTAKKLRGICEMNSRGTTSHLYDPSFISDENFVFGTAVSIIA